jgi:cardiolipin synthase A/B
MGFWGGFMRLNYLALVCLGVLLFPTFAISGKDSGKSPIQKPPHLPPFSIQDYSEIRAGSSPDNSFSIFFDLIESAEREIRLAAYMLRSPEIAGALENAVRRGVSVSILLDGWTVGRPKAEKIDDLELYFANKLSKAGAKVLYLKSDSGRREDRRYRYLHAKYAIVDSTVFFSSENFATSGFSPNGTQGNRGWVIAIKNEHLAKNYIRIFELDSSPLKGFDDLRAFGESEDYQVRNPKFVPTPEERKGTYYPRKDSIEKAVVGLERAISPDDNTDPSRSILSAIESASETINIQSLSFAPHWGSNTDTPETNPSLYAEAVLEAARRGVKVRVMLNPQFAFFKPKEPSPDQKDPSDSGEKTELLANLVSSLEEFQLFQLPNFLQLSDSPEKQKPRDTKDNGSLIKYFREVAKKENLDIQAHYFFLNEDSIKLLHNKGMVVDDKVALISSMNWTENSIKNNREVGILVENPKIAQHYSQLFETDWKYFRNKK